MCGSDICLGLIAILFPPLAVWVKRGICSADSLINIALLCLGFFPGLFHAWYIIATTPDPTYEELAQQDPERGNVTYYYVQTQPLHARSSGQNQHPAYGTVPNAQFPSRDRGFVQPQPAHVSSQPESSANSTEVPPTYQQATAGDNKIQQP